MFPFLLSTNYLDEVIYNIKLIRNHRSNFYVHLCLLVFFSYDIFYSIYFF